MIEKFRVIFYLITLSKLVFNINRSNFRQRFTLKLRTKKDIRLLRKNFIVSFYVLNFYIDPIRNFYY